MEELINDIDKGGRIEHSTASGARREQSGNGLPITDILFLTLRKWPWIVLSLVVCVGAALFYTMRKPTIYTRAAEIMIKDTSKGQSVGAEQFADFGLLSTGSSVQNEITNLRSADLMREVADRLDLDYNYYLPGKFQNTVAYGSNLPVHVSVTGLPAESTASFRLAVSKDGKVEVSDIAAPGIEADSKLTLHGALGDSILSPVGSIIVSPTANYHAGTPVELTVDKMPLSVAQQVYSSRLLVSQNSDNSTVIRLQMSDYSIDRADDILSTLIEVYKDSWIRDRNEIAVSTSRFINDRLAVIEEELGDVENSIYNYKSENLITDNASTASRYISESQQYAAAIEQTRSDMELLKFVRSYITDPRYRTELLPVNAAIMGDAGSQINHYNELLLERNALAEQSSEKNPLVEQKDRDLEALRKVMVATVDNQQSVLSQRLATLRASQAEATGKIATSPLQAKYLLSAERQQKVKESLYMFLLQKREENELSQAFTAYNTRIISQPGPAGIPPRPARGMILMVAVLLGLALPFGVIYLLEMSNTKVRGRKDIRHLTIPFLGEIPEAFPAKDKKKRATTSSTIVVKEGKRDVINEAFRVLRTNVEFMANGNRDSANVIAITSFNPGSGKSFISVNLAQTISLKGKRVLVIDGDMRHGSTSAYVGRPARGLANYLSGATDDIRPLLCPVDGSANFAILPVGPVPPNPTELLESPRFTALLDELRPQYDYIFIDCPPIEVVADAQIIDRCADRTIFIIRAGLFERVMLGELETIYEERKYRNMSLILNGTQLSRNRYGYSHGYHYGYSYGYGYGYGYGYNYSDKK